MAKIMLNIRGHSQGPSVGQSRGFGLLGVLLASVLLIGLFVTLSRFLTVANRGKGAIQDSVNFTVLEQSILQVIRLPTNCQGAFLNQSGAAAKFLPAGVPAGEELSEIRLGSSTIAKIDMQLTANLRVSKLELTDIGGTPPSPPAGKLHYNVQLFVQGTKPANSVGGRFLSNVRNPIRFAIRTDATTNEIESCLGTTPDTVAFHVNFGNDQSPNNSSFNFTSASENQGDAFNLQSDQFTPTTAGLYFLSITAVAINCATNENPTVSIRKNGSTIAMGMAEGNGSQNVNPSASAVTYLDGSADSIRFFGNADGCAFRGSSNRVVATGFRISS